MRIKEWVANVHLQVLSSKTAIPHCRTYRLNSRACLYHGLNSLLYYMTQGAGFQIPRISCFPSLSAHQRAISLIQSSMDVKGIFIAKRKGAAGLPVPSYTRHWIKPLAVCCASGLIAAERLLFEKRSYFYAGSRSIAAQKNARRFVKTWGVRSRT